jgi:hypothetical protein
MLEQETAKEAGMQYKLHQNQINKVKRQVAVQEYQH